MDINSIMSQQVAQLQQTVSMGILEKAMTQGAAGVIEMMQDMPQPAAPHPYKGQSIDIQV